ncbi:MULTISPECIES: amino acid ABC transporter permease [Microbacterium]|uniref:Glutamate transport system permease protein n=1 Tax=Microbacterium saccharophilum TaxID=1213358 RepID=A0A7Z7GCT9_9MICO|nr:MULTISPECIES: amino acid ABC transporter permease [Microbacterium]SFI38141.1 glutamate transport system permease protein [Microbacterium saccharophilum]
MSGSVLYDVPGPRAQARNRIIGAVTIVVVLAIIGFVIWRLFATGQFSAQKWELFGYTRVWQMIGQATLATLTAFAAAGVGAIVLGFILGIGRLSDHAWVRRPVMAIVELLRAVPVLVFMLLLYYGLPVIDIRMSSYWAVVLALVLYNGSVLSEVIRAGVESLPRGQQEAGYAVGLRKAGVMRLILLPQAIRAMMPVIIAQLVVTLKDTALGFIITYPELLYTAKLLGSNANFGSPLIPSAIIAGTIYIAMCLALSYVAHRVQERTKRSPKVQLTIAPLQETTDTQLIATQARTDNRTGQAGGSV